VVIGFGGTGGGIAGWAVVRFGSLGGTGGGAGESKSGGVIRSGGWTPGGRFKGFVILAGALGAGPSSMRAYSMDQYGFFGIRTLNKPGPHGKGD
jgi:hypothetical protein